MNRPLNPNAPSAPVEKICRALPRVQNAVETAQRFFLAPGFSRVRTRLQRAAEELSSCRQLLDDVEPKYAPQQPATIFQGKMMRSAITLLSDAVALLLRPDSADIQEIIKKAMSAFRKYCQAQEVLFSLRFDWPAVDVLFGKDPGDGRSLGPPMRPSPETGLFHISKDDRRYARGSFSLYVPETYARTPPRPLIVALHGGFGHGRDYLWFWLREARRHNLLLLAPTSTETTWSITGPNIDRHILETAFAYADTHWRIDKTAVLLTGISDGGTYALARTLDPNPFFTDVAVIAATLPPADLSPVSGKRILWLHGALDWMFPLGRAQLAGSLLEQAGADIAFHVIHDLAHAYPREKNDAILRWFMKKKLPTPEDR